MSAGIPPTKPDLADELARWAPLEFSVLIYGQNCFSNHLPDVNGIAACFWNTGGPQDRFDNAWVEWTVQVKVLAPQGNYQAGWDLINAIYRELHGAHRFIECPSFFLDVAEAIQKPYPLGRDDKNREVFVFNILAKGYEA